MIGGMLAVDDETPGGVIVAGRAVQGVPRDGLARGHEGAGLLHDRYFQGDVEDVAELIPEGIEGRVPYKGPLGPIVHLGACRRCAPGRWATAERPRSKSLGEAQFVRITGAGLRESHPHDVTITKDAPNYRRG